ncbi:TfoX/Sxy family DNA transformation protein [Mannheimia sp. AT1]|uniref:TfoX/Sxy family DNA transformation protein n=1 Tax=Mannheimia cairinae TaxID=3025936 RepID=A0ABT5MPQ1_9PAST|nr:TfoX/Sxy family DNA transformation protein [Mannheimia cairinae]MDD0824159.1 TfoX/Sxy family DNA transformation protein [Mannheimia cairinae]MDD0826864.1 TfoX/Sxy family DNA transformation protein [Mannheimia cairinae]
MQTINEIKQEITPIFTPIIGEIRLKTYFSYYAVFKDDLMIALYQNKMTYLRIAEHYLEIMQKNPETYTLSDDKIGLQSKKFFYIPNSILTNTKLFNDLTFSILNELRQKQYESNRKKATQIRNLPNMNIKLERMLKKVGIDSIQNFNDIGYISAYIKLVKLGVDASEDLLFKLNGALNHQYIYTFTEIQKRELMQEANQALYANGLRKRFFIEK